MSLHEAIRAVATDRAQRPIRCEPLAASAPAPD